MTSATMSEELLQQHIVKLLEAYARYDIEWHHVPNGADRHPAVAEKLRLGGVKKPGVADLMFLIDGRNHLPLELKTESRHSMQQRATGMARNLRARRRHVFLSLLVSLKQSAS